MAATRASDADRDSCVEDIEAAFADGRINDTEREARTQAALQATTLPELTALVSDLGPTAKSPSRASTPLPRPGRNLLIGILVPAIIAVTIWIITAANGDDETGSPSAVGQETVPEGKLALHTAAGLEELVTLTRAKFGTTLVDSAAIYPDYASIEVVEKDDPRRVQRWYFSKGYEGEPTKGTRAADAVSIDLASIDSDAYVRAIKRAPSVLGVEDIETTYVIVRDTDQQPSYSVYASNEYSESGYFTFTADGQEIYRYAFE